MISTNDMFLERKRNRRKVICIACDGFSLYILLTHGQIMEYNMTHCSYGAIFFLFSPRYVSFEKPCSHCVTSTMESFQFIWSDFILVALFQNGEFLYSSEPCLLSLYKFSFIRWRAKMIINKDKLSPLPFGN